MLGRTISHYEILSELGRGGMGVVYRARDTRLGREVAIKFLPPHLSGSEEAKKRFVQEAKSASALDHPNICTIYEIDETEDGATFIAMALYRGKTLRQLMDEGPFETDEALDITRQISSGLSKAHEIGIVHRDIKPSNIIITADGLVKILDFGIAKLESATKLTREGTTMGTVAYVSPEQATGAEAGPETDVWATGVILYEMLAGRKPFTGEHEAALIYGIVHEEHPPLPDEVVGADTGIRHIVDKALAKDPAERYRDSGAMRDEIKKATGETSATRVRTAESGRRRSFGPLLRWGSIVAIVAVASLIGLKFAGKDGQPKGPLKIAVLPFTNLGAPADSYFVDGITEAISDKLGSIKSVRVIGRQSVVRYRGSDKPPGEIAVELGGLDYILNGTLQRERPSDPSSRVRIRPALILVEDGTQAWSHTYDQEMTGIFAIQSDIAEKIANAIDAVLPGSGEKGGGGVPTRNLRAYEFYLKGNSMVEQPYYDMPKMQASCAMYMKALEIDPDYVDALVSLAIQSCWIAFHGYEVDSMSARATAAIERAEELEPRHPGIDLARGTYDYVFYKDFESAGSRFQAAYDRNPSSLEVVNSLGWVQRRLGQWEEALATFLKAKELDPGIVSQNLVIAEHLMWMRRYDEAERYFNLMRELDPDDDETVYLLTELYLKKDGNTDRAGELLREAISSKGSIDMLHNNISDVTVQRILVFSDSLLVARMKAGYKPGRYYLYGEMYNQIGETALASEQYDSLRTADETLLNSGCAECALYYTVYPQLGFLYARLGMKEKALRYAELGVEKLPVSKDALQGMVHLEFLAKVCAITGEKDRALILLDQILAMPVSVHITPGTLRLDPLWDPIRDDPRFDELIRKYSKGTI